MPTPSSLPENTGLTWLGEPIPASARLSTTVRKKLLSARNPCGRPNADVMRPCATCERGQLREYWVVDFPPDMDAQEARLYAEPFRLAPRAAGQNRALRNALARRDRYLATPVAAEFPDWLWLDSGTLPDDTLLTVARDDDFTHGILSSHPFALWWQQHHLPANPTRAMASFPFPWSPQAGLSALSRTQEEHRHAVARAARGGDLEALNASVAVAYGWPSDLDDETALTHLGDLNRTRATQV